MGRLKKLFRENEFVRELAYLVKPFFDSDINPSATLFQALMIVPFLRILIFRLKIGKVGKNLKFKYPIYIQNGKNITIGDNATFGPGVYLVAGKKTKVKIGDNLSCGAYVSITARTHGQKQGVPMKLQECSESDITIGNDVLLGVHSVILENTRLADGTLLAANSEAGPNFTNNPDEILVGIPARPALRRR